MGESGERLRGGVTVADDDDADSVHCEGSEQRSGSKGEDEGEA